MARPQNEFPRPGLRAKGGAWRIFWNGRGKKWEVSVGRVSRRDADLLRDQAALALAGRAAWPAELLAIPAVARWIAETATPPDTEQAPEGADTLADYEPHLRGEVDDAWARTSLRALRELRDVSGVRLDAVTPAQAQAWLDHVLRTPGTFHARRGPRTASTRNRFLAAATRFYKWAIRAGRVAENPFAGIRQLKVRDREDIAYFVRAEMAELVEASRPSPDGLAIRLALYAGLRKEEIARADWQDVLLSAGRLVVPKAKNFKRRALPLAKPLLDELLATPERVRRGRLVPWPAAKEEWRWRSTKLLLEVRARLMARADDAAKVAGGVPATHPAETAAARITKSSWNVFRHTFGSLLAQAGVSLDKISAWMGNTPDVCRRHYAQFVPRDRRDDDIDKM